MFQHRPQDKLLVARKQGAGRCHMYDRGELEKRLVELSAKGESTAGLNLDISGSVALGSLGDQVHQYICRKASDRGVEMGPFVNPGYREWPLTDQGQIFMLMPASSIGIALDCSLFHFEDHRVE